MDASLQNALIYSAWPAAIALAGGALAAFRLLPTSLTSTARRFASGAVFAVIAIELLPDVLRAHSIGGIIGFGLGVVAMIVKTYLYRRWVRARDEKDRRLPSLLSGAGASIPIAGVLIGGGFVAGIKEGQLLTLVAVTLAAMIIAGATAGGKFMWGRAGADLDLIFAICLAALSLGAMESLVESYE